MDPNPGDDGGGQHHPPPTDKGKQRAISPQQQQSNLPERQLVTFSRFQHGTGHQHELPSSDAITETDAPTSPIRPTTALATGSMTDVQYHRTTAGQQRLRNIQEDRESTPTLGPSMTDWLKKQKTSHEPTNQLIASMSHQGRNIDALGSHHDWIIGSKNGWLAQPEGHGSLRGALDEIANKFWEGVAKENRKTTSQTIVPSADSTSAPGVVASSQHSGIAPLSTQTATSPTSTTGKAPVKATAGLKLGPTAGSKARPGPPTGPKPAGLQYRPSTSSAATIQRGTVNPLTNTPLLPPPSTPGVPTSPLAQLSLLSPNPLAGSSSATQMGGTVIPSASGSLSPTKRLASPAPVESRKRAKIEDEVSVSLDFVGVN